MATDTSDIVQTKPVDVDTELAALARRYHNAGKSGVRVLTMLGTRAESLLDRLPEPMRNGLHSATEQALRVAMRTAWGSRAIVPDQSTWTDRTITTAMGAVGGLGGLPGALVELPLTTTMLLRTIQTEAARQGFNPDLESVRFDCVQVFGAAGPLAHDDGSDLGFLSLRMALTGRALEKLISTVAPKLGIALSQKVAAQSVPVLGAIAGASTNFIFTRYYQDMAHVHFGLRNLAIDTGHNEAEMLEALKSHVLVIKNQSK